jgi:transposase
LHGVDTGGKVVLVRQLRRGQMVEFFTELSPCLIGMEACATGHHWARELTKLGHTVKLMPASYVKAYVKRSKNDAADAAAVCEAVTRPSMRCVPVKTVDQQAALMLHRARDLLVRQRTQLINAIRAHLAEVGLVAANGVDGLKSLLGVIAEARKRARLPEAMSATPCRRWRHSCCLSVTRSGCSSATSMPSIVRTRRAGGWRRYRASA